MRRVASFLLALTLGLSAIAYARAAETPTKPDDPAATEPEETSSSALDKLYARLARTQYPDEAVGILQAIDQERMHSGSDTADLLMAHAQQARTSADLPLALQLFDSIVYLYPDWSEAWSERATTRFQSGDVDGAMGDLAQTLKREPRDVGALAGLGSILLDAGQPEDALRAYDRALALAPAYEPLKEARARAQTMVWSREP
jgi:tetratricopeptide (TPR) repeat protein